MLIFLQATIVLSYYCMCEVELSCCSRYVWQAILLWITKCLSTTAVTHMLLNPLVTVPSECRTPYFLGGKYSGEWLLLGTSACATHCGLPNQSINSGVIALGLYWSLSFLEPNMMFCLLIKLKCNLDTSWIGWKF